MRSKYPMEYVRFLPGTATLWTFMMFTTYITVCQNVYYLYACLGDCIVRSLHTCKYPGNVTEWGYLGVCKSAQRYTRGQRKTAMQSVVSRCMWMYWSVQRWANISKNVQRYTEVYSLAHLISQRWLCSEETHTCCCHGFQFLSLWVKGSRRMREGRG